MNVLFLTLLDFGSLDEKNLYTDLLRVFARQGHQVYAVTPLERRQKKNTALVEGHNGKLLRIRTGNTQKTGLVEKGLSTVTIPLLYRRGIERCFKGVRFDLLLYSTPPITLDSVVEYIKRRDGARTYLLLKDIFPQNALDIGMLSRRGVKGLLYRAFRAREKRLYQLSDRIGCMSQANVDYLLSHNPEFEKEKVEVCPNAIEVVDKSVDEREKLRIREKYGLPRDRRVFVYGGNLGRPQGVPFILDCLQRCAKIDAFFLIVGSGTEYGVLERWAACAKQTNFKLLRSLPKDEYDTMTAACDVGLLFLDHRFTIPNFPSRLLSYMQAGLPVLACTDPNTDVGKVIVGGGFGWRRESDDAEGFAETVREILALPAETLKTYGRNAYDYLVKHYSVEDAYRTIMRPPEEETPSKER